MTCFNVLCLMLINVLYYFRDKHFATREKDVIILHAHLLTTSVATMKIQCQFTGCDYTAEHDSEAVAIAYLQSHSNVHIPATTISTNSRTQLKAPQIARPELKQDISAEDWYSFVEEWKTFKRIVSIPETELADQLLQCCDRPLSRLLLKENPDIVEEGEKALLTAMKRMAVLQVAVSVRRAKLLATTQEHSQSFREYYANIRSSASTCEYVIKCPHACCAEKELIDYTSKVVKDILVGGVVDIDIRRDVMGNQNIDNLSAKEFVQLVEEKEVARNACNISRSDVGALSQYKKDSKQDTETISTNKKLSMKGNCSTCKTVMKLYIRYRNGKMNKEPFQTCAKCYKSERIKQDDNKTDSSEKTAAETNALTSYIDSINLPLESFRFRSDTC